MGDRLAHIPDYGAQIQILRALDFMNYDQAFFSLDVYGKRRATAGPQRRVTSLHRELDILRIMVPATDDDQVFGPTRNEYFAVLDEPQIARA
jgi:hypothetical protein